MAGSLAGRAVVQRSWLNIALADDIGLKLVALGLAVAIWTRVSVFGTEDVLEVYARPITLENLDPALEAVPASDDLRATITAVAPRRHHLKLGRLLRTYVDLRNIKSPLGAVTLRVETNAPQEGGLRVTVKPPTLKVLVRPALSAGPSGT